jgi:hypothetical protein
MKREAALTKVTLWFICSEVGSRLHTYSPFAYAMKMLTRSAIDQPLRVFFISKLTFSGRNHITVTSILKARLLPQSGKPIRPDRTGWSERCCLCLQKGSSQFEL